MLSRLKSSPNLVRIAQRSFAISAQHPTNNFEQNFEMTKPNLERPSASKPIVSALLNYPAPRETILDNGIRVITEKAGSHSASVGVLMRTGSRYESDYATNGVAHFVEHMLFKGTKRRSRQDLELEVERMGGHLNAYTTRDSTTYVMKVTKDKIGQAVDILGDMLTNSVFHPLAIEKERYTILREARSVEENLLEVTMDNLHSLVYPSQPIGNLILGTDDHIRTLTKEMMHDYVRNNFVGERMFIVATGDIDHDEVVEYAKQHFGSVPQTQRDSHVSKGTANFNRNLGHISIPELESTHIAYAFETAGWEDVDLYPLFCFQMLLDSYVEGNTSSLYSSNSRIVELAKLGVTKNMDPFNTIYSDSGIFGLYMALSEAPGEDLQKACEIAVRNFLLTAIECTEEDLEEAKKKVMMSIFAQMDGSTAMLEDIGRSVLAYGKRYHPLETLFKIDSVTTKDVVRMAEKYFLSKDPSVIVIGNTDGLTDYEWWKRPKFSDPVASEKIYAKLSKP